MTTIDLQDKKYRKISYEFVLIAETPIAHHAENLGNAAILFRKDLRQPDGSFARVPYVTADTMRHGLRESAAYAMLDATGLLDKGALTESALRFLFSGGLITGGTAGAVKLDEYREMVSVMPALSLLGGCAANRAIPGNLAVEDATLICDESLHLLPAWVRDVAGPTATCRAHVEETTRVRMDPLLDPGKRTLLTDGEHHKTNQRLLASEAASEAGDAVERRDSKSSMMPRSYETLKAGSLLFWRVTAVVRSDLELAALQTMVAGFLTTAVVGGKKGTGCGRIAVLRLADGKGAGREYDHFRPAISADASVEALALASGSPLAAHYRDNAERITRLLATVEA